MDKLSRSTALKFAAIIVLVLALIGMIVYDIPDLTRGMAAVDQVAMTGDGPPFFLVLLSFSMGVLSIVAAYGAWRAQRWGVILAIVVSAYNIVTSILGALFAPTDATRIFGVVSIILYATAIILCLWREDKQLAQSG